MSEIRQLTQSIRCYAECELDYGTLRTLQAIDDEADALERLISKLRLEEEHAHLAEVGLKIEREKQKVPMGLLKRAKNLFNSSEWGGKKFVQWRADYREFKDEKEKTKCN